jgi:hypothetical protein
MTISSDDNRTNFVGDGSTTVFNFSFRCDEADWIYCYIDDVAVDPADFTATVNSNQESSPGGYVTLTTAPAVLETLSVIRTLPVLQEVNFVPYEKYRAETVELALDRLIMICQQLKEEVDRSFKEGIDGEPDLTGYAKTSLANTFTEPQSITCDESVVATLQSSNVGGSILRVTATNGDAEIEARASTGNEARFQGYVNNAYKGEVAFAEDGSYALYYDGGVLGYSIQSGGYNHYFRGATDANPTYFQFANSDNNRRINIFVDTAASFEGAVYSATITTVRFGGDQNTLLSTYDSGSPADHFSVDLTGAHQSDGAAHIGDLIPHGYIHAAARVNSAGTLQANGFGLTSSNLAMGKYLITFSKTASHTFVPHVIPKYDAAHTYAIVPSWEYVSESSVHIYFRRADTGALINTEFRISVTY